MESIASLRRQNEIQESRMPSRPPVADQIPRVLEGSRLGHTAASVIRNVPDPTRLKDLIEHPERAPLAAAKGVASRLGPIGAPVTKAVDGVAKQIDRSSGVDHDR